MKKQNKNILIILILTCSIFLGIMLWLQSDNGLNFENRQEQGSLEGLSLSEIEEMMKNKVEEGNFTISINTEPVFPDGKSDGTLRIENSPHNRYLMIVKIYLKDKKGEKNSKIYESGAIRPGNILEYDKLDRDLDKGSYMVVAEFEAYDEKTQEYVGKAASELTIMIEK